MHSVVTLFKVQSFEGHIIEVYGRFLVPWTVAIPLFGSFEAAGEMRTSCY